MGLIEHFQHLAVPFSRHLDEKSTLAFSFKLESEIVHGHIEGTQITIREESQAEEDIGFKTDAKTFKAITDGEIEAFTAAAKGDVREPAPLEWEMKRPLDKAKINTLYAFLMHFFQSASTRIVPLEREKARVVHGASAIPLFYRTGMRSAFYVIDKGDQLNEEGDTNPFDQAFIVIKGEGKAKIGEETLALRDHVAYHVPKDGDHVVWNENDEPLELIWLAWGEGA